MFTLWSKWSVCNAMYIGNTHQKIKKSIGGNSSNLLLLLNNGQKPHKCASHSKHHFKYTISSTDPNKFMTFKLVNQLNLIGAMKTFTKHNYNLCTEERLTILKNLLEKRVTVMNKNSEIYGVCRHIITFHWFFLSIDDPV